MRKPEGSSGKSQQKSKKKKTKIEKGAICVFAGRDSAEKNEELGNLMAFILDRALKKNDPAFANLLDDYFFIFTEGTLNRIFVNRDYPPKFRGYFWDYWLELGHSHNDPDLARFFEENCICFRGYRDGGILLIADLVVNQRCSIVWPFLDPHEAHCTRPENLALVRLCDVWKAKWLPNLKSVIEWVIDESALDARRSKRITVVDDPQMKIPLRNHRGERDFDLEGRVGVLRLFEIEYRFRDFSSGEKVRAVDNEGKNVKQVVKETKALVNHSIKERQIKTGGRPRRPSTLALISHDAMKPRMVEFVVEYKKEIDRYVGKNGKILTTYATGKMIRETVLDRDFTDKIVSCLSGPLGGDIQIATEILLDQCDCVIFFIDPLTPHEHIDDIRVVLMAGMTTPSLRVLTNGTAARAWAEALRRR